MRTTRVPRSLRFAPAALLGLLSLCAAAPAFALPAPASGTWALTVYSETWANPDSLATGFGGGADGQTLSSGNPFQLAEGTTASDTVASVSVCNYTGYTVTFTLNTYPGPYYVGTAQTYSFTVSDGYCAMANLASTDVASLTMTSE